MSNSSSVVVRWPIALVVMSLLLSACGGSATAPASSPAAAAPASKVSAAAAPPSSVAPSAGGTPIKIGVLQDLTGFAANNGKDWLDGWNFYWATNPDTVAGRKIQSDVQDVPGQPDVALTKAKQLVENDKVDLITGFGFSTECFAVAPYARQMQMPMVVTGNCAAIHLLTDSKFASPYLLRLGNNGGTGQVLAQYAYQQGARNAIVFTGDNAGYQETVDAASTEFVLQGGHVIQEIHPPVGSTDYGPYFTQFDPKADSVFLFIPGLDGLRFGQTFQNYLQPGKYTFYDLGGGPTLWPDQLKAKIAGMLAVSRYDQSINNPLNQAFVKAWHAKYPGRIPTYGILQGYVGAQYIVAALTKVAGNTQDKQKLLDALYTTSLDQTVMGPVKLGKTHDLISDAYIMKAVESTGGEAKLEIQKAEHDVGSNWGFSPQQLANIPFGTLKGQWLSMTPAKLAQLANK